MPTWAFGKVDRWRWTGGERTNKDAAIFYDETTKKPRLDSDYCFLLNRNLWGAMLNARASLIFIDSQR